ncbi:uncharacterized protein LOC126657485 [Mercurialis annua]|uniref:uncharacterized protein LOC126657485 n=1 Tax=Mercurialis annua TaxID=3986 RepID=UPI00215E105B|nr:uncharacterized protein LOC126657485 [Mercurialis annua]
MGFEEFKAIYAQPKVECSSSDYPFLMHIFAPDDSHLQICATDFHSNTFAAVKSLEQLDDMRDSIGIGGSWSEFIDYLVASLQSEDLKLMLHNPGGVASAKLVAQKSKGMPLISVSLPKLTDSAANDAIARLSFALFNTLKGNECASMLTKVVSVEKDASIQSQAEKRQKSGKMNSSDNGSQNPPDKRSAQDPTSKKVTNRVVPAYRRAKVRGALLQDTEDDKDN